MRCDRCKGRLAIRILNTTFFPIIDNKVQYCDAKFLADTVEVYCTVCNKVDDTIKVNLDKNSMPLSIEKGVKI